jgi:hypothetical protein
VIREGRVLISVATDPDFGSNYYVTAYEVGAQVTTGSSGNTVAVGAGHGFAALDKFIVGTSTAQFKSILSVTSTQLTLDVGQTVTVAAGDLLVNLGQDTGTTTPSYVQSVAGLTVYSTMDYSAVAVDNTVQTDANGRYRYFHTGIARWELARNGTTPIALYTDTGLGTTSTTPTSVNVMDYGAAGDGVANDTAAVLAAMIAVPAGGRLYFPKGTYLLSTWSVRTQATAIWMFGDGIGSSIIKGTGSASFVSMTANLRCSDLTFDTWSTAIDFSAVASVLDKVVIENIEIKTYNRAIYGNSATAAVGVRNMAVRNCQITTGTSYAIFINLAVMDHVTIHKNTIKTCVQRGIDLGNNSLVFADDRGQYVIEGNVIDGVTGANQSAIGMDVFGWRAVISGNIVSNVTRTSGSQDNVGIYTKCRYAVVTNNVLVDAGQGEAMMNIKGGARNETVAQPYGFSVIVTGNQILDTQTAPTLAGGSRTTNGIKIATSEVLVANNTITGMTDVGIYTDSDTGSDAPCHNLVFYGNTIKDHRGDLGMGIFGRGNRIRIMDNLIDTVDNSFDPVGQNFGIKVAKTEGSGIDIVGNRVYNIVDNAHTPVAIGITPSAISFVITADSTTDTITTASAHAFSVNDEVRFTNSGGGLPGGISTLTTYYVKTIPTTTTCTISATLGGATLDITSNGTGTNTIWKLVTLAAWRVADNHCETARFGIQFTWNELYVTVDDVFVRHNTGKNINSLSNPNIVSTDMVKYSDTPTNLIDLPARAETIARVSATVAELKNSTSTQDLKIYGTDDGAGNYERLSVRMDASHSTIDTQFGGAGVIHDLEIQFASVATWKFVSSGTFRPVTTAVYDFGSDTVRPRDIFVGRDLKANAVGGRVYLDYTNTATIGDVTINKISGRVIVAALATAITVTNSRVTAASHVFAVASQNDASGVVKNVVPAAGSFVINLVATTAQTTIDFVVFNAD